MDWKRIQSAFDAKLFHRGDKKKIPKYFQVGVNHSAISRRLAEGATLRADSQNTSSAFLPEAFLATSRLTTLWTRPGHTPKRVSEDWKADLGSCSISWAQTACSSRPRLGHRKVCCVLWCFSGCYCKETEKDACRASAPGSGSSCLWSAGAAAASRRRRRSSGGR
jgi:hypothetical protein